MGTVEAARVEPHPSPPPPFYRNVFSITRASLVVQMIKNLPTMQDIGVQSLGREDLLEKGLANYSMGESHGQRSLVGYSP